MNEGLDGAAHKASKTIPSRSEWELPQQNSVFEPEN